MQILPYNRVLKDLNGLSPEALLDPLTGCANRRAWDAWGAWWRKQLRLGKLVRSAIRVAVDGAGQSFHHDRAARLPRIDLRKPARVIGTNTVASMQSGLFWGYVGLIEGIVARIKKEFGRPMKVVSTGGLAPVFDGHISGIDQIATDITARGLIEIFKRSKA